MQVPHIVVDFLMHGIWLLMSAWAIVCSIKLVRRHDYLPALLLVAGAIALLFSQVFLYFVPAPTISWSYVGGCCYEFRDLRQLGGYFSVELAPVVSSLFWLLAIALLIRRRVEPN